MHRTEIMLTRVDREHFLFFAENHVSPNMQKSDYQPYGLTRGPVVDYESHKITTTTQSTTVAELYALMKCFGARMFLRGLWAVCSGDALTIHIRTDANNLVLTTQTTPSIRRHQYR